MEEARTSRAYVRERRCGLRAEVKATTGDFGGAGVACGARPPVEASRIRDVASAVRVLDTAASCFEKGGRSSRVISSVTPGAVGGREGWDDRR